VAPTYSPPPRRRTSQLRTSRAGAGTCRPAPFAPTRATCSRPNQLHLVLFPGPPPPPDRPASITLLVFDNGAFIGTSGLERREPQDAQNAHFSMKATRTVPTGNIMMPSLEMRLLANRTSVLLLIIASSVSVGCASAGRTWSSLAQPAQHISGSRVIPGNWEAGEGIRPGTSSP
jgi:hypothetical protein